jgi:uncharacterized protein
MDWGPKKLATFLGYFAVLLGVIGIFLPLLPTTPFLLLAAYFFSKGNPRIHSWLINHPRLGPPVRDWNENRVIRPSAKWLATLGIGTSLAWMILATPMPWLLKIFIAVVLTGVIIFVWVQKSR